MVVNLQLSAEKSCVWRAINSNTEEMYSLICLLKKCKSEIDYHLRSTHRSVLLTHTRSYFFKLFSFMGFIASVIWIYSSANEIVNLLRVSSSFL